MQKTKNSRIYYINLLRVIAIFLVIINHGPTLRDGSVPDQLSLLFSEAAVPVFFMASGAVLLQKESPGFIKYLRRLITVYAAMTVWRLIYLVLAVPAGYAGLANASAADVINYLFFFGSLDGIPAGHLWFMTAYLAIYSMLPLLHSLYGPDSGLDKAKSRDRKAFALFFLVLLYGVSIFPMTWNVILGRFGVTIWPLYEEWNPFGRYAYTFFFFVLGGVLHKLLYGKLATLQDPFYRRFFAGISVLMMLSGLGGLALVARMMFGTFGWTSQYVTGAYQLSSTAVLSTGLFLCVMLLSENRQPVQKAQSVQETEAIKSGEAEYPIRESKWRRLIALLGSDTMGIYYVHILLVQKISMVFYHIDWLGITSNVVKTLIVLLLSVLFTEAVKRIPLIRHLVR